MIIFALSSFLKARCFKNACLVIFLAEYLRRRLKSRLKLIKKNEIFFFFFLYFVLNTKKILLCNIAFVNCQIDSQWFINNVSVDVHMTLKLQKQCL